MKRSFIILFAILSLFATACVIEEIVDNSVPTGRYTYVFDGVCFPETKVSVGDKVDGRWPVLWEKGDVVGMFKADGTLVGSAVVGAEYAGRNLAKFSFSSDISLSAGETVHFVYPYTAAVTFSDGSFTASLSPEQTQKTSTSSEGVGRNTLAYASAAYSGSNTSFTLSHANSYIRVNLTPGEFKGYTLKGVTLWGKGESLSGKVNLDSADGSLEVAAASDYVSTSLQQPVVMEEGKSYSLWLASLPADLTGKELYAIVHMAKDEQTVTLPVLLKNAGNLLKHAVTTIPVPALSKSFAPSWYEPVEKRYIAANGKGWAYGAQNTVLFKQSDVAQTVEFKARGNFMKVVEPRKIQVVYASDLAVDKTSGIVFIGGEDSYAGDDYKIFDLDGNCSQSIAVKKYYTGGIKGGHMAALYVMDKDENIIWGTNLWLAIKPFVETQYMNGKVLDRNIGSDCSPVTKAHWTSNGCYFQWGRPWAFPWTNKITGSRVARVDETFTLEESASNPYTFIYHRGEPEDWYYGDGSTLDRSDDLDDRWGNPNRTTSKTTTSSGVKSIYDPCPEGYMVVSPGVLAELENDIASKVVTTTQPNYLLHGGVSWGFSGGYIGTANGSTLSRQDMSNLKDFVATWSNSTSGPYARVLWYQPTLEPQMYMERPKTAALPVRCMVEVRNVEGTAIPSGPGSGGSSGGEIDDEIKVPEGFQEEQNDASADKVGIFDYSVLANAGHPRLLIDAEGFATLKRKVTVDRMYNNTLYKLHQAVINRADKLLEANQTISGPSDHTPIVYNLVTCAYAYRMTGESRYLNKVMTDMRTVCAFADWAPGDLSIGEISFAMAIAYDWLYYDLPLDLRTLARQSMSNKGVRPMYNKSYAATFGNWNSVCLGGCACASLAIYEKDKDAAVKQLEKAVAENRGAVEAVYQPHGNYLEGLGYWEYGSSYQACFMSALEGIFGHTAGIAETPGFMESGEYALFMHGTANSEFSYSDGGSDKDPMLLSSWWFAAQNDDPDLIFCEKRRLDKGHYASSTSQSYRLLAPIVVTLRDFDMESRVINHPSKKVWSGQGEMPVVMVRKGWTFSPSDVYLGVKGGLCNSWRTSATSHAHMDAGSFVFEAEGVRWSDDAKKPDYDAWFAAMKASGSRSGNTTQGGLRWDTFRINNLCHSTIVSFTNDGSVNGKLHDNDYYVDGFASIDKVIDTGDRQGAVVNMSEPMKGQVKSAKRTVELVNGTDLVVTDEITALDALDCRLEWRMLTAAEPSVSSGFTTLTCDGNVRTLVVSSSNASVTPEYKVWEATRPGTDYWRTAAQIGWKDMSWDSPVEGRVIAGWSATVPAGKTVKFVTTLKK